MKKLLTISCMALMSSAVIANPARYDFGDGFGRKLDSTGLGFFGHVAVGFGTYQSGDRPGMQTKNVIEVLDEAKVIQANSIENFQSKSQYWGARYGIVNLDNPFAHMFEAREERDKGCTTYTLSNDFWPTTASGGVKKCGQFRCDTFVRWVLRGENGDMINQGMVTTPAAVHAKFPFARPNGMFTDEKAFVGESPAPLSVNSIYTVTPAEFNKLQYQELDTLANQYRLAKSSESDAHAKFWNLAQSKEVDMEHKRYALDTIAPHVDESYIQRFIEQYHAAKTDEEKTIILRSIERAYQNNPNITKTESSIDLIKFFKSTFDDAPADGLQYPVYGVINLLALIDATDSSELEHVILNSEMENTAKFRLLWELSLKSANQLQLIKTYHDLVVRNGDNLDKEQFEVRYKSSLESLNDEAKDYINQNPIDYPHVPDSMKTL